MLPSKCCFCMDLDRGVKAYQIFLNFEALYMVYNFIWVLMWCLWKPPTYEKYDFATDAYALTKYTSKFYDA